MRRALLAAAAAALPSVALAAQSAAAGQVTAADDFFPPDAVSYLNAGHCAGDVNLLWNVVAAGGAFAPEGTYRVFASNTDPSTRPDPDTNFCNESNDVSGGVFAGQVAAVAADGALQQLAVPGSDVAARAGKSCDASSEGQGLWICVHWYDASATRRGWAWGRFAIQVGAPDAPVLTSVSAGEGELVATFDAPAPRAGAAAVDHYVARATPAGAAEPEMWGFALESPATISWLSPDTAYDVVVYAYSVGGNSSPPSSVLTGTPLPWPRGPDHDGERCSSGAAGAPALLALLGLAVLRRRAA